MVSPPRPVLRTPMYRVAGYWGHICSGSLAACIETSNLLIAVTSFYAHDTHDIR